MCPNLIFLKVYYPSNKIRRMELISLGVKKDYLASVVDTVMKIDPSLSRDEVHKIASRMIKERMTDPSIIMDNNVTGENARITLTEMCNWIDKRNPVVSGNGTFYMQPTELLSPTSNMLRSLKKGRKAVKKQMFSYKPGSDEYEQLDLDQQNKKVIMNAEYGGSGAPTAAFYTKYSPAATTLMAQSIITTMAAFFEGYVGDNQKFFHVNECYDWMNTVCQKTDKIPSWVMQPTREEVLKRITQHFYMFNVADYQYLKQYIDNCTKDQLIYLFYANNLRGFIMDHPKVQNLISSILGSLPNYEAAVKELPPEFSEKFESVDKYNKWMSKEMFLDPYNIPDSIKGYMEKLITLLGQFVYVEYITPDSIVKLNNHLRNTVLLVDTDSNVINADLFVSFIINEIFPGQLFGRTKLYNEMILVNVLAACLDKCVIKILDFFGRMHNMDKDSRAELTMKNEFMFRRFFLMLTKKRYGASIVLREGNIIIPFKPEIKGLDFMKAGVTDDVTERFSKMLKDHILFSDELELHELMRDLKAFENEIYHDLRKGGTRFLKPQMYKAEEAYAKIKDSNGRVVGTKAWSLPVFRGSAVWNELYPAQKIYSLDRVKVVKLTITSESDLEKIKHKFPEEYKMIKEKVFHSSRPEIQKAGLKVISLPASVTTIPAWILEFINYDIIISDVISSFRSVLEALKLEEIYFKTPNGNANVTSCLISL